MLRTALASVIVLVPAVPSPSSVGMMITARRTDTLIARGIALAVHHAFRGRRRTAVAVRSEIRPWRSVMPSIVTGDKTTLHYYDTGGEGRPVVLIAGYGAPADSWALQWAALRAASHRVISLDRRWHGRSGRPPYGHRMSRHGKDLRELLEQLDLRDALVVGQSMGASTIWAYASLFGCDRLAGIVTVDQTPKMVNSADWKLGYYGLTAENLGTFLLDPAAIFTGRGRAWPDPVATDALVRRAGGRGLTRDISPDSYPLLFDHACQDWRDVVAGIDVPALIVAGAESQFWPAEHAAATAALSPLARAVVVSGGGHPTHIDQPEAVARLITDFAASLA
ncbi:alpha/beta hydrolase [Kitasatospora sp. NBC_00240]|uniref:alpha/beta fold hydrolase n=1 Tax=Kitasatospora sp. NBC_00240 TaxID=2903567 RepID=UPI002251655C|nr:alpha/beta hydrolase [Kitasatospora sp. NBC_00240]MCX5214306.1 alpha/beta hydrolase [Kitasatospora sp. NBC_00240]